MSLKSSKILSVLALLFITIQYAAAWGSNNDKVLLRDISTLTLQHGGMTSGKRSSPVPQLKCVGGTAGCGSFTPQTVQCYNRGSDGYDVQWECKTDMDNAYRFGKVEVTCEGYDNPDDDYILKGSCGLEYSIDLTKEGHAQQNQGHHDYYGQGNSHSNSYTTVDKRKKSSVFGDLITLLIVGIVIYAIYKTCISTGHQGTTPSDSYGHGRPRPSAPPPPGFRPEYTSGDGCSSSSSTNDSSSYGYPPRNSTNTGGGFWSGAATGGMLGYLFGSRTNTNYGYQRPYGGSTWGSGWGSSWGSGLGGGNRGSSWGSGGGYRASSPSTGTRTASGFGGTRRR